MARATRRPPDRPPWIRWIDEGDRAAVASWLAGGGDVEDEDSHTNNTPLEYAAWHGQREIVNLLLAYGANGGSGAFLVAVATGQADIARVLLPLTDYPDHLEQAAGILAEHTDDEELEMLVNIKLARLKAKKGRNRSRP